MIIVFARRRRRRRRRRPRRRRCGNVALPAPLRPVGHSGGAQAEPGRRARLRRRHLRLQAWRRATRAGTRCTRSSRRAGARGPRPQRPARRPPCSSCAPTCSERRRVLESTAARNTQRPAPALDERTMDVTLRSKTDEIAV